MKVLYLSKAMFVAAYRTKLADLRSGADVTALVPAKWGKSQPETEDKSEGIDFRRPWMHGHNHLHMYPQLAGVFARNAPDLVHIDEEPYSLVTWQAARLCRQRGVPSIFFAWQNLHKELPAPFGRVRQAVFNSVAGGIAGTQAAADVLRQAGFAGPLAVVPQFGVDPDVFTARTHTSAEPLTIGFGGRLVPEKGVDVLLRAVAPLANVNVTIAGDGPMRTQLERLAGELGMRDRVKFAGQVDSRDMPKWLHTIDILALPSRTTPGWTEQFGRILVEAMASGVPVIATRTGEIASVVKDAGLLIDEDDVEALRAHIVNLAESTDLRATLGTRGRARVLANYTSARIAEQSLAFYRDILAGTAR